MALDKEVKGLASAWVREADRGIKNGNYSMVMQFHACWPTTSLNYFLGREITPAPTQPSKLLRSDLPRRQNRGTS